MNLRGRTPGVMAELPRTVVIQPDGGRSVAGLTIEPAPDGPLISCLMLSRGELFPAGLAIDCYRRQSYANRELLIVCDRPDPPLDAHLASLGDPSIRIVHTPPCPLGELRNVSIAHARGTWIATWDDDDLHHADRLAVQASVLASNAVAAVMLERWTLWWPARRTIAISGRRAWEGSMLARRDAVPVYPALPFDEDRRANALMMSLDAVALVDWPAGYCYVVHGANTYGADHFETMLGWASEVVPADGYDAALTRIAATLPIAAYRDALDAGRLQR